MAENMTSVLSSVESLMQMFDGKAQDFIREIDNVHMVWLKEIQQEADRMFTRDFNVEPELMPKTPSQKRTTRRKRVSLGRQEDGQARRRFSKGRRSNLRGASSRAINCIAEEAPQASTSKTENTRPKRATRKNKQTKPDEEELNKSLCYSTKSEEVDNMMPEILQLEEEKAVEVDVEKPSSPTESPKCIPSPEVVVAISSSDRLSAELAANQETSPQCTAAKMAIAEPALNTRRTSTRRSSTRRSSTRRTSMRCSLKLRHSLAGLRQSRIQESVRASARNKLKRMVARKNSTCDSNADDSCMDSVEEEDNAMVLPEPADTEEPDKVIETKIQASVNETLQQQLLHITRSVTVNSPKLAPQPLFTISTPDQRAAEKQQNFQSAHRSSTKRKAPDTAKSPTKRCSAPKKSQSAVRPNMRSFLHTVQKNQMLMMPPSSLDRSTVLKSFIKHTTPLRVDLKTKERYKLEALKKKQEQEIERMKKIEEEKKKKQDELKRKRDERLRRVFEAKEQKEEEKKKRIEQKMAQTDWKNDKRLAEEKTKKKETIKRQEELELKKKLEEEAKKKLQQAEEEKRYHELLAKKKAEEEERAQRLAETRRALELKREQERELEKEQERQAAAKREQFERERALALQRELERAAREKERRELEEKRKALEEKRKREQQQRLAAENKAAREREAAENQKKAPTALNVTVDIERSVMTTPVAVGALNVTVDIEGSPQSYTITPKGGNKLPFKSTENYGMDQNSDDSTDDESAPRKPIPSWAEGHNLQLFLKKQYFNPPDLNTILGKIEPPNLEIIFNKRKPRYFKRTSSAVWHSPPAGNK